MPDFSDSMAAMNYLAEGPLLAEYVRRDSGEHVVKLNAMGTEQEIRVSAASKEDIEPGQSVVLLKTRNSAGYSMIKAL